MYITVTTYMKGQAVSKKYDVSRHQLIFLFDIYFVISNVLYNAKIIYNHCNFKLMAYHILINMCEVNHATNGLISIV